MMTTDGSSPDAILSDPWTPDQETALLKALVHYKPVGLHAHFRMLSIRNHLLNSGTTDSDAAHTRIPGIWAKIKSLYDTRELDEREDEVFTSLDDDEEDDEQAANDDETTATSSRRGKRTKKAAEEAAAAATTRAANKPGYWRDFELPTGIDGNDFEALMWERRLNPEGTPDGSDWETGSQSRTRNGARDATEELQSSPVGRGTRSGRKGRVNRLKDEMEVDTPTSSRGSRRASKAASEAEEDENEDQDMEDVEEDDEDEADNGDANSDDEEEGDENKKSGVGKRGRGGRRIPTAKRGRRR